MLVSLAVADGIATITLDSPANRNALSRQLVSELLARLDESARDESARVVVIRSSSRVFCAGADLSEAASTPMTDSARGSVTLQHKILTLPKPVVVELSGPVRAGGLGIVAAADIVVAADDVTFAFTEARLALAPAVISLSILPRLTSRAAYDTFLSGRTFDAAEAAAMGLVTRAVPREDLAGEITATCEGLRATHPQGLRETKQLLARPILSHLHANADAMVELSARLFASAEAKSAMEAFLKR